LLFFVATMTTAGVAAPSAIPLSNLPPRVGGSADDDGNEHDGAGSCHSGTTCYADSEWHEDSDSEGEKKEGKKKSKEETATEEKQKSQNDAIDLRIRRGLRSSWMSAIPKIMIFIREGIPGAKVQARGARRCDFILRRRLSMQIHTIKHKRLATLVGAIATWANSRRQVKKQSFCER
jgi:hypothetical protein